MNGVGASVNFANSYEAAQSMFRNTLGYTDSLWKTSLQGGYINDYVNRLNALTSDAQLQKNLKDLDFDLQEDEYKQLAIYNETEKSLKTNMIKHQVVDTDKDDKPLYARDKDGNVKRDKDGNPEYSYHSEDISEYEYNRNLLKQNAERIKYENQQKELQSIKDSKSWFEKAMATVGGTVQELVVGAAEGVVQFFGDIYNIVESFVRYGEQGMTDAAGALDKAFQEREVDLQNTAGYEQFRQDISKWLADSTWLREVDGQATYYGNLISGIGVSFGRMIPSMLAGNAAGALGASASMASWISTGTMYTAVAASNMYELCSNDLLSSSTAEKLLNASLRSATEMLIEKGLAKALGATGLDALTQGFTQKVGTKSGSIAALSRITKDAMQEGLEEFLQEYSNYFIDRLFALNNEGYLYTSDWNFEVASTAFLSGALMSLGGSFINVLKTQRVESTNIKYDKQGNIVYDKDGNAKYKKFGKLASYEFNINFEGIVNSMYEMVQSADSDTRTTLMEGAYGMIRTLSSYFANMSEEVYNKSTELLRTINSDETAALVNRQGFAILYSELLDDIRANGINVSEEAIKENNLRGKTEIYSRNDMDNGTTDDATLNAVQAIFAKDANVEKVVIAENGKATVESEDGKTIIVPKKYANKPDEAFKYIVETRLKRSVLKEKRFTRILDKLSSLFETRYNSKGDNTQVLFALLTNADFRMDALCTNNVEVLNFVSNLAGILTTINDVQTANLAKQYLKAFQGTLVQYYSNTIYKDFEKLSDDVLSKKDKETIRRNQYPYDYKGEIEKGLAKSKNREAIVNSLIVKINAMTELSADEKTTLIKNVQSNDANANRQAFTVIEKYWYNTYNSEYNNRVYFEYAGQPQSMANSFLHHYGIDIPKLMTSAKTFAAYNNLFRQYTQGRYEFKLDKNNETRPITIVESSARTEYTMRSKATWGVKTNNVNSYAYTIGADNVLGNLVNVDADTKNFLTINDIVYDTSLLKENIRKDLEGKSPAQVVEYLTSLYLKESNGTKTLVQDNKGNYIVSDVSSMSDMETSGANTKLQKIAKDIDAGKEVKVKASTLFKTGNKEVDDATIIVKKGSGKADAGYDSSTNTITLYIDNDSLQNWINADTVYRASHDNISAEEASKKSVESKLDIYAQNIKYLIWHEFRHAIQTHNRLSVGMTGDFLSYFAKEQQSKIIKDLKEHVPEFFKNAKSDADMANDLLYYSAGGEMQNADIDGVLENKFVPFITDTENGFTVRTPWGSIYSLDENGKATVSTITEIDRKAVKEIKKVEQQARVTFDTLYTEEMRKALEGDTIEDNIFLTDEDWKNLELLSPWVDVNQGDFRRETEVERQKTYEAAKDAKVRMSSLKQMYLALFNNKGMTFEQFLQSEIPFVRTQNSDKIYDNKSFLSATVNADIQPSFANKINYMFVGTVKVSDILAFVSTSEFEILLKPQDVKKATMYRIDDGNITSKNRQATNIETRMNEKVLNKANDLKADFEVVPAERFHQMYGENIFYNGKYISNADFITALDVKTTVDGITYKSSEYNQLIALKEGNFVRATINKEGRAKLEIYNNTRATALNLINTIQSLQARGYKVARDLDVTYAGDDSSFVKSTTIPLSAKSLQADTDRAYTAVHTASLYEYAMELDKTSENVRQYMEFARKQRYEQLAKKPEKIIIDGKEYTYKELEAEKQLTKAEYAKKMQAKRRIKLKEAAPAELIRANTISYNFAKGTNLEKYIDTRTHKHPYMDYRLQNLIVATTGIESSLDYDFVNLVDSKTFAKEGVWTLLDYVRKHPDMNNATFKLINDNFFHNDNIKSSKELSDLVNNAGMAYALRGILKYASSRDKYNSIDVDEIFNRKMTISEMKEYVERMKTFSPDLYKIYETAFNNFNRFANYDKEGKIKQNKTSTVEHVNDGLLAVSLLENYDGSLFSYGSAAVWPNVLAYDSSLKRAGARKTTSLEQNIKNTKSGDVSIADTLASQYTTEDMAFSNKKLDDIILDLVDYKVRSLIKQGKIDAEEFASSVNKQTKLVNQIKSIFEANPEKTIAFYKQLVAAGKINANADFDLSGINAVETTVTIDRSHLQKQIYNMATRTIINKMDVKSAKYRRFQEAYSALGFTKDGKWQMPKNADGKAYTAEQVTQLQKDIAAARAELQAGTFDSKSSKTAQERIAKLKEQVKSQQEKLAKQRETIRNLKNVQQTVTIANELITIVADKEMPSQVKQLFDTTFDTLSKTNVQNISKEGDVHTKKSYSEFVEKNSWLATLDSASATDIAKYLLSAQPQFTSFEADTKWKMTLLYTYSYISSLAKTGAITIDYNIVKEMQNQYRDISSGGGQLLNAVRTTLDGMNPYSIALESAMKRSGINIDKSDLEQLTVAMNNYIDADIADKERALVRVQELTDTAYAKALQNAKDSKAGKSVINKIIKFRTMAMLSSPGTWIRNITTNILVEKTSSTVSSIGNATWGALNKLADKLGGAINKKRVSQLTKPTNQFKGDRDTTTKFIADNTGYDYNGVTDTNTLFAAKDAQTDILKEYDYVESQIIKTNNPSEQLIARRNDLLQASQLIDADIKFYEATKAYNEAQTKVPLRRSLEGQYSIVDTLKDSKYKFKENKDGTYSIEGVVVNKDVTNFILDEVFNSGLFDQVKDGISKYDNFDTSASVAGNVTGMIVKSISSKLFYNNQFDSKAMNWLSKGLYKMLSDEKWVNRAFVKYLAATLVEDRVDISKGITKEVMKYIADSFVLASADYMHKSSFIGDIELKFRERFGEKAYAMWKFIFPFANASWNWFTEGLRWTPFGLAKSIYDFARFESTVESYERNYRLGKGVNSRFAAYITKRNIGKGIVGSIGFVAGMLAVALGVCGVEEDKKDKKTKIRIGDVYLDFSDLFGTTGIGMGLILSDAFKNKETFFDAMIDTLDYMFDDTIFSDVYDMMQYKQSFAEAMLDPYKASSIMGSFIPNLLKTITSSTYIHEVKYSSGFIGMLERLAVSAIPGLAYGMPKQYDPYTGQLQYKYTPDFWGAMANAINRFSSVKVYPRSISALEKEALKYGVSKGNLTGKYKDIGNFSADQVSRLNEMYGELNNKALTDLMRNKVKYSVEGKDGKRTELYYRQMSDEQKNSVISRIMTNNAKMAKVYVWTSEGHKYYATESFRTELVKNGIRSGVYLVQGKKEGFVN